jgi:CheY-like chemotaxis protein
MESAKGAKQRKNKRVLIMQELVIDGKPAGQAIDLSMDGMYVSTRAKFTKGDVVTIRFQLDDEPMEVKGRILYRHEGIGMGVKFVSIKSEDAQRIALHIEKVSNARAAEAPDQRKQVLIIDDTLFYQTVYQQRLMSEGYSVLTARNGLEGLKILMEKRPDLILLDLIMEGMDGYKVLQIIKSEPNLKDIPVIVISVKGSSQEVSRAMELGASDYMVKATTSPHQVAQKIRKLFH